MGNKNIMSCKEDGIVATVWDGIFSRLLSDMLTEYTCSPLALDGPWGGGDVVAVFVACWVGLLGGWLGDCSVLHHRRGHLDHTGRAGL